VLSEFLPLHGQFLLQIIDKLEPCLAAALLPASRITVDLPSKHDKGSNLTCRRMA
jgi:hypothetical protein